MNSMLFGVLYLYAGTNLVLDGVSLVLLHLSWDERLLDQE